MFQVSNFHVVSRFENKYDRSAPNFKAVFLSDIAITDIGHYIGLKSIAITNREVDGPSYPLKPEAEFAEQF